MVVSSQNIKTESDYLLAGRRLGILLGTFTVFATWFGSESCIGTVGRVYSGGLSGSNSDPFAYTAALLLMGFFFARKLWQRGFTTIADLYRQRYSVNVERLAVIILAPTSVMWAAAQIRAFGSVLAASGTISQDVTTIIATIFVVLYTVRGGLLADAYTDLMQGIFLIIGLIVITVIVTMEAGGLTAAWQNIEKAQLSFFNPEESWLTYLDHWAAPIFGSLVAQELIARVLASRSMGVAQRSCLYAGCTYLLVGMMPVFIGLVSVKLLPGMDATGSESVLPLLAKNYLHPFLYILFAGAVISAILSTVDTALLVSSSLVCHNVIIPMLPGGASMSEKKKLFINRTGVVLSGIVAYFMAISAESVYELVLEASSLGSSGIFVVTLFGLFTRFGSSANAIVSMLVGLFVYVYGSYLVEWDGAYIISLGAALISYIAVSFVYASQEKSSPLTTSST